MYVSVSASEADVQPATVPAKRDPWAFYESARPTDHQRSVLNKLWQALSLGDNTDHLLTGYAGTGKTFSLALLLKRIDREGYLDRVTVAAPTHKAARQLEEAMRFVGLLDLEVVTVARLLGLKERKDYKTGEVTFERDDYNQSMITPRTRLVIIDEISMVSERCIYYLRESLENPTKPKGFDPYGTAWDSPIKVLAVGDPSQLPPVEDSKLCSLVTDTETSFRLEEVVRHDGAILQLATQTRELGRGRPKVVTAEGDGSKVFAIHDKTEWTEAWLNALTEAQEKANPDLVRALCWTNRRKDALNLLARERLFGVDAPPFVVGEQLLTAEAIPDPDPEGGVLLHSTTDLVVLSAFEDEIRLPGDDELGVESLWNCWCLRVATRQGQEVQFHTLAEGNQLLRFVGLQKRIAKEARELGEKGKDDERKDKWRLYFRRRDQFGKVQNAAAITIHKSQGSTFRSAFVDLRDIDLARDKETHNRLAYTAFTRASEMLFTLGA